MKKESQEFDITFQIIEDHFPILQENIREYEQHCVTYLIHDKKQIYIGETSHLKNRFKNHFENKKKQVLTQAKIITSEYFNKSAVYDLESRLINYIFADNQLELLNIKKDQSSHNYYLKKEINDQLFRKIWNKLQEKGIAKNSLTDLENRTLFKYSPFKELSSNQNDVINKALNLISIKTDEEDIGFDGSIINKRILNPKGSKIIINGGPGTGKTLLIVKMVYDLIRHYGVTNQRIAICIPQSSLLQTFKKMFKEAKLKVTLIKPIQLSKVEKGYYDLLIVDEAHRLKKYFSKQSKDLKHLQDGQTELEYALKSSNNLVLMYDENQSVRPADISSKEIAVLKGFSKLILHEQFRVKKGANYLLFLENLLQISNGIPDPSHIDEYQFEIVEDINTLYHKIRKHNEAVGLSRLLSGYFKEWISKKNSKLNDFADEGLDLPWNRTAVGWIHTKSSPDEVGCIHTIQGEDLNYAGVIIGDEIYYDPGDKKIKIRSENYYDRNGTPVKGTDPDNKLLTQHIKSIYYVLLSRGMLGTYVYIKNKALRDYFKSALSA